ncbi:MAG: polysaccharide deacetylase family protein [Agriterribacter sp.]
MQHGKFVISLDFELMWGVRDVVTIEQYGPNIAGVQTVIPKLLDAFERYAIKGTFSTVGFLFFETKSEMMQAFPKLLPSYNDPNLSPYNGHFNIVKNSYKEDVYHFAPQLIQKIKDKKVHEISTHTFSHYYCLEPGQTKEQFADDLKAAIAIAEKNGINITSIIYPRNQYNLAYADVCTDLGITSYRGNEQHWIYDSTRDIQNPLIKGLLALTGPLKSKIKKVFRRMFRMMDSYVSISGHNCYSDEFMSAGFPVNIPSSRLLRPYAPRLSFLEGLRLRRIKKGMTYAAKHNLTFHLWWHPHNFGVNQNENFAFFEKIATHYKALNSAYGFESVTMSEIANRVVRKS